MTRGSVVYFGNWGQGLAGLRALLAHQHVEVVRVFTRFDPAQPGSLLNATRDAALAVGVPVTQSDRDQLPPDALLRAIVSPPAPDFIVTCCFDRLLPETVLRLPRRAAVNVHASLLPSFRGPKPMENALARNAPLGVTLHLLAARADAGDIVLQQPLDPLPPHATVAEAFDHHNLAAAALLARFFDDPDAALARAAPQDESRATPAPRLPFPVTDQTTLAQLRSRLRDPAP